MTDESAVVCGEFLQARHEEGFHGLDCPEARRDCACASRVVAMQRGTGVKCSVRVVSNRQPLSLSLSFFLSLSLSLLDLVHCQACAKTLHHRLQTLLEQAQCVRFVRM